MTRGAIPVMLVCLGLLVGWFGPWRVRRVLANTEAPDGTRYLIVQNYKDFAASGWVLGVYRLEQDRKWRLRWSRRSDSPWKRAGIRWDVTPGELIAESASTRLTIPLDQLERDVPPDYGWVLPEGTSSSEMQQALLHTTY